MSKMAYSFVQERLVKGSTLAGDVKVDKVTVKGDASVVFSRGKKRCGFDLDLTIHWEGQANETDVKGKLKVPSYMAEDLDDPDDVHVEVTLDDEKCDDHVAAKRLLLKEARAVLAEVLGELRKSLMEA